MPENGRRDLIRRLKVKFETCATLELHNTLAGLLCNVHEWRTARKLVQCSPIRRSRTFNCFELRDCWVFGFLCMYSVTPLVRISWDGKPSGYTENPDNWIFSFKICQIGSLKFGCYYVQYVPASKRFDYAWFKVLGAITLYWTWSDNR